MISRFKYQILIVVILILAFFLRVDRLDELMVFYHDMGLFYLPAKEMFTNGIIPLVGPETSHPWIHHGPLWIYVLGFILWLFNFNPIVPAYFIAILGVLTILLFYYVLKKMFGVEVAILTSILYATSPFMVINSRFAYHTSPIPILVILLFYFTYKLVKGSKWSLPVIAFLLGTLYNHEITTFVYFITVALILVYGFIKREKWFKSLLNLKILFASAIAFLVPMIPFILYDINHGYNQTLRFLVWVVYRIVKFPLSLVSERFVSPGSSPSTLSEFFSNYQNLIFSLSGFVTFLILLITIIFTITYFYKNIRFISRPSLHFKNSITTPFALLFAFLIIGATGLMVHRVPIGADTLLISPFIIALSAISILWMVNKKFIIALILISIMAFGNIYFLVSTEYGLNIGDIKIVSISKKIEASEKVIKLVEDRPYNLVGRGELSDFKSFTMPYEYLLWWKGSPPTKEDVENKIIIWEKKNEILVFPLE